MITKGKHQAYITVILAYEELHQGKERCNAHEDKTPSKGLTWPVC